VGTRDNTAVGGDPPATVGLVEPDRPCAGADIELELRAAVSQVVNDLVTDGNIGVPAGKCRRGSAEKARPQLSHNVR
jgi:hypothetical protein